VKYAFNKCISEHHSDGYTPALHSNLNITTNVFLLSAILMTMVHNQQVVRTVSLFIRFTIK